MPSTSTRSGVPSTRIAPPSPDPADVRDRTNRHAQRFTPGAGSVRRSHQVIGQHPVDRGAYRFLLGHRLIVESLDGERVREVGIGVLLRAAQQRRTPTLADLFGVEVFGPQ